MGVETDQRIVAEIQKKKDDFRQTKEDLEEQMIDRRIQQL